MNQSRNMSVDIARGIAMIAVVLGHLKIPRVNSVVYTFHLPIFWLITGYYTKVGEPFLKVVKKRARTLLVPYYAACVALIVVVCLYVILIGHSEEVVDRIKFWGSAALYAAGDPYTKPFVINSIGALWFLWATFLGTLFLNVILRMRQTYRIFAVLGLFAFGYYSRALFWFPLSIQAGMCATFFMYAGHLAKDSTPSYEQFCSEVKVSLFVISLWAWVNFIMHFQSFWLVHCDIGRGALDVVGSLCACYVLIIACKMIEKWHFFGIDKCLAYFGQYSIIMLVAHWMELSFSPWHFLTDALAGQGCGRNFIFAAMLICKFIWIFGVTVICSRISFVRNIFGMKPIQNKA